MASAARLGLFKLEIQTRSALLAGHHRILEKLLEAPEFLFMRFPACLAARSQAPACCGLCEPSLQGKARGAAPAGSGSPRDHLHDGAVKQPAATQRLGDRLTNSLQHPRSKESPPRPRLRHVTVRTLRPRVRC